jgi:hypothetical protein
MGSTTYLFLIITTFVVSVPLFAAPIHFWISPTCFLTGCFRNSAVGLSDNLEFIVQTFGKSFTNFVSSGFTIFRFALRSISRSNSLFWMIVANWQQPISCWHNSLNGWYAAGDFVSISSFFFFLTESFGNLLTAYVASEITVLACGNLTWVVVSGTKIYIYAVANQQF